MSDSPLVAFELRSDADDLSGATVALANGDMLDVLELLDERDGKLVLSADSPAADALAGLPVLKSVAVDGDDVNLEVEADVSDMPDPSKDESSAPPPPVEPSYSSKAASDLASEHELELADLFPGSGKAGAVTKADVEAAIAAAGDGDSGGDESPASSSETSSSSSS